jgi:hypothetical protein
MIPPHTKIPADHWFLRTLSGTTIQLSHTFTGRRGVNPRSRLTIATMRRGHELLLQGYQYGRIDTEVQCEENGPIITLPQVAYEWPWKIIIYRNTKGKWRSHGPFNDEKSFLPEHDLTTWFIPESQSCLKVRTFIQDHYPEVDEP